MAHPTLPHQRPENKVEPMAPFTTMDDEIRAQWNRTHPDYGSEDDYGNKALPHPKDAPPPTKK